jgi:hypothetical protein
MNKPLEKIGGISPAELASLRSLSVGAIDAKIPREHLHRFLDLGYIEQKMSGHVLTAVGRYQLESRARESGLSLLANRWRRRADKLTAMAAELSAQDGGELRRLAQSWRDMADQIERLESAEKKSASLV